MNKNDFFKVLIEEGVLKESGLNRILIPYRIFEYKGKKFKLILKELKGKKEDTLRNTIIDLIKENDNKGGIEINHIKEKTKNTKTEEEINKLLEEGFIFEIKPNKLKWLG